MQRLAILGSSDLGQQIAYHALNDGHYQPVGFFDDYQPVGTLRHGLPVLGGMDDVERLFAGHQFDCLMVGIGYKHLGFRRQVFERFKGMIPFGTIVHRSSYLDAGSTVAQGSIVYPGCTIDFNSHIGENCLLNVGCVVAHDSRIGPNSFLSPGVCVAGFVEVEGEAILGIGSVVIDNVRIARGVRTAGGTVVTADLDKPGLYAGVPGVWKKE